MEEEQKKENKLEERKQKGIDETEEKRGEVDEGEGKEEEREEKIDEAEEVVSEEEEGEVDEGEGKEWGKKKTRWLQWKNKQRKEKKERVGRKEEGGEKLIEEKKRKKEIRRKNKAQLKKRLLIFYEEKYKTLMIITLILFILAIGVIGTKFALTGEFIEKGVSLSGGATITVSTTKLIETDEIKNLLEQNFPKGDFNVRLRTQLGRQTGFIIEASGVESVGIVDFLEEKYEIGEENYTSGYMGPSLGTSFFKEVIIALIFAFVLMAIVVFITFRVPAPSLFVILAATSDIICTWAVLILLNIKLTSAGIAAFLMLVGYSVDTDILLTTRVLKRKEGTVFERVIKAMKTGMTMSLTSLSAVILVLIFTQSEIIRQIMLILFIGLIFDLLNTWLQNAGILRWYLEKKKGKQ